MQTRPEVDFYRKRESMFDSINILLFLFGYRSSILLKCQIIIISCSWSIFTWASVDGNVPNCVVTWREWVEQLKNTVQTSCCSRSISKILHTFHICTAIQCIDRCDRSFLFFRACARVCVGLSLWAYIYTEIENIYYKCWFLPCNSKFRCSKSISIAYACVHC